MIMNMQQLYELGYVNYRTNNEVLMRNANNLEAALNALLDDQI